MSDETEGNLFIFMGVVAIAIFLIIVGVLIWSLI